MWAKKHCKGCGKRRGWIERLAGLDDELCDNCYYRFFTSLRERHDDERESTQKNSPDED